MIRAGGTWRGVDGTTYRVVKPEDVGADQPRWWIDEDMLDDYALARRGCVNGYAIGPESPFDLHYLPACDVPGCAVALALVEQ